MRNGISLIDLAKNLEESKSLKTDLVAPAKRLEMHVATDGTLGLGVENGSNSMFIPDIREIPHNQIGTHLNIPAKYYDRMRADAPDLLAHNVNTWLNESADDRMLRLMGGNLRGYLSNRYHRIENEEIAESVIPVLVDSKVAIRACDLTESKMYICAVLPTLQAEVKVGDVVRAGVMITNSEVGLGAASVRPFVERLVCLNGMTRSDGKLTARHVGRRITAEEDLNAIYSDEAKAADDRAVLLKIRDVVRHALDETAFHAYVGKMRDLTEGRVEGSVEKAVEILSQKVGANETEKNGILRSLIEGADLSAWGLMNAVTFQAHSAPTFDRSVELTEIGGKLIDMPRSEWKEILTAA